MSPRLVITLAIIAAVSTGVGATVFGVLVIVLGDTLSKEATVIAIGSSLVTAGLSALMARSFGGFRELEDHQD